MTLIHSAKVKIPTSVYQASRARIYHGKKAWSEQHLVLHVYSDPPQRFSALKVEGNSASCLANARKVLDEIANGITLTEGGSAIWSPILSNTRLAYSKLKSVEHDLQIKIFRDNSKRQLQFFGPPENFQQAVRQVLDMLAAEPSTSYEIDLKPHQFHRMVRGNFKRIEQASGGEVVVFDVVSKIISVNGTLRQYNTALAMIDNNLALEAASSVVDLPVLGGDCSICLCEADTPAKTACEHTYCFECFEGSCKSAASTSQTNFQIKCQGDGGNCSKVFDLDQMKAHLSSQTFESVLKSSFGEYIQRHAEVFRYCPTPDCGFIYRCTPRAEAQSSAYTCPNCFEPICTSCHARHGGYSCAEYKDIASGGREALERLKKELNIKDCPKCTTPMEKFEGCNHMTCGGCKSHICWVCMAVFETSAPCYDHMNKIHGGIGLGLEHLMIQ